MKLAVTISNDLSPKLLTCAARHGLVRSEGQDGGGPCDTDRAFVDLLATFRAMDGAH